MQRRTIDPTARAALRTAIVVAAAALAIVPLGRGAASEEPAVDPHLAAARTALARLDLGDRAGQVIMTSVHGATLGRQDRMALRQLRPGGIIVFADNHRSGEQLRRLLRRFQVEARRGDPRRPRVLVSVDQEGGVVKRIPQAPPHRSHPQLGGLDDVAVTRRQARATGRELAKLGIHMDLAPVADLDVGPRRVMRQRSFGAQPSRVAEHVAAFVDGLQDSGVAASIKHFPGFGGASVNSDDALATIARSPAQLARDLQPFRAGVDAGTESVMMSHGVYTRVDRRRPASTSPAAYRLLRQTLDYEGVAITDSLHAAGFGAATGVGIADGCVRVVAAGADIALLTGSVREAQACRMRLVAAVRSGTLPKARLDEAATRVLRLKSRLGLLPEG